MYICYFLSFIWFICKVCYLTVISLAGFPALCSCPQVFISLLSAPSTCKCLNFVFSWHAPVMLYFIWKYTWQGSLVLKSVYRIKRTSWCFWRRKCVQPHLTFTIIIYFSGVLFSGNGNYTTVISFKFYYHMYYKAWRKNVYLKRAMTLFGY